jgi:hypothetical protein
MTRELNAEAMEKGQTIIELLDWLQQQLGDQLTGYRSLGGLSLCDRDIRARRSYAAGVR